MFLTERIKHDIFLFYPLMGDRIYRWLVSVGPARVVFGMTRDLAFEGRPQVQYSPPYPSDTNNFHSVALMVGILE